MAYAIIFKKGATVIGTTPWKGDFTSAKGHAVDHFPIHQKQQGVDCVQITNDHGQFLFSYPRVLKKAP